MSLYKVYKQFTDRASCIPGFIVGQKEDVPYDIDVLANKYCEARDANDEEAKDKYISALLVRYWHLVPLFYKQSAGSGYEMSDMIDWIFMGIQKATDRKARKWLDKDFKFYNDRRGPEKCINRCIYSVRCTQYQRSNYIKRRFDYNTISLDDIVQQYEKSGDVVTLGDTLYVEDTYFSKSDSVDGFVVKLLGQDNLFGAITTWAIARGEGIMVSDESGNYSDRTLIEYLHYIPDEDAIEFAEQFGLDSNKVLEFTKEMHGYYSSKMHKKLDRVKRFLRKELTGCSI